MTGQRVTTDVDLFSDEIVVAPYEAYRDLRDTGPAVWMSKYDLWALSRYREVYDVLHDHQTFSSASGVGLSDELNNIMAGGSVLNSDPPAHGTYREIIGSRLTPRALKSYQDRIEQKAAALVEEILSRDSVDAAVDIASVFPLQIAPDLLGWPEEDRINLLDWGAAAFQTVGPMNDRTKEALPRMREMVTFAERMVASGELPQDSWGGQMLREARDGQIDPHHLPKLMIDYVGPSIDTTVSALSTAFWMLGKHPDQWSAVREDRTLAGRIMDECLRYEAPIRGFSRLAMRDVTFGDMTVKEGERVFIIYASANRDERRWEAPDTFNIQRNTAGHVGFGHGIHHCIGHGLAKMQSHALFSAFAERVDRIEAGEPEWETHNILRFMKSLPISLHAAA